ncbi:tyrosine-type recombinase/integrase [Nocardioides jensenii]|uniref:tyrosine-type recombinase/integrase n=1 Tax=Nocardioides jensenii TaxID=1843 RepID=UPI00082DDF17|nr:site-specific integrase [Nocardioides jensenii]
MSKTRSDGEGSVYIVHAKECPRPVDQHGRPKCKCRYRGAVVVGYRTSTNGRQVPIRETVTAATRSGCAAKVRELHEKHAAQTLPVGKSPTLEQWLNHCHARLLPGRVKDSTLVVYRGRFDNYLIPLLGHVRLDRLSADDIEDAWTILRDVGNPLLTTPVPLSAGTVHSAHVTLRRMLRLAVQRKKLQTNPAGADSMDAPPPGNREVEPLATEDWKKVLATAPQVANSARYTVALAMGLRQGEALGLRWADLDLEAGVMRVRQILHRLPGKGLMFGSPKTRQSARDIALPVQLVAELKAHRKAQNEQRLAAGDQWQKHDLVFTLEDGRPLDPSVDRRRWKALLKKADVPVIKLHAARHTAATIMLLEEVDPRVVMDIMGWTQISTAANYQHAVAQAKQAAAAKLGSAIWG